jgi:hypothetical protein
VAQQSGKSIVKKAVIFWVIGSIVGLYTTFVLQNIWSWFVTEAFHLSPISYWVMYGLVLIIGMFTSQDPKLEEKLQFKALATGVDACIPEDKQESVKEQLEEHAEQVWWEVGSTIFGKLIGNSITLAIGWAIHTFLVP